MSEFPGVASTRKWLHSQYEREFLDLECGVHSYGKPKVILALKDSHRRLVIGDYCSIAADVTIFLGAQGRHSMDGLSTFPLWRLIDAEVRATVPLLPSIAAGNSGKASKYNERDLDVLIGSDVWIGAKATILAGVKIGHGAVIGTGALVTKDVPPFAIVGGVPAKILKYRFQPEIVDRLLKTAWWELDPRTLWAAMGGAFNKVPVDAALTLMEKYRGT